VRQLIRKNIQGCVSVQCCCYCICRRKRFVEDDVLVKPLGLVRFAWASGLDGSRALPCQPPHGSLLKSSITVGESMVLEEITHSDWTEYWEDRKVMPTKGVPVLGLNILRMVKPTHLLGHLIPCPALISRTNNSSSRDAMTRIRENYRLIHSFCLLAFN
jgi:hypothetical protein